MKLLKVVLLSFTFLLSLTNSSFALDVCPGIPKTLNWSSSNCTSGFSGTVSGSCSPGFTFLPVMNTSGSQPVTLNSGSCTATISCNGALPSNTTINVLPANDPSCVVPITGVCNNLSANACTAGTLSGSTADGAGFTWYCDGTPNDAPHRSPQCSWQPSAIVWLPGSAACSTIYPGYSGNITFEYDSLDITNIRNINSSACTPPTPGDCSLPWGGTIASGASVTANQTASVPAGNSCVSQTRTCTNTSLSGTYTNQTCTVGSSGPIVTSLSFSPSTIAVGGTSVVSFTSSNATACYGTAGSLWVGDLGGVSTPPGGVSTPAMNTAGTFSQGIYCTGPGGTSPTVTASLTVGSPPPTCSNGATNYPTCTTGATGICGPLSGASPQEFQPTGANACSLGAFFIYGTDPNAWLWSCGPVTCSVPKGLAAGVDCPATAVTWGSCSGTTGATTPGAWAASNTGLPTSYTYALDAISYSVVGSYVGSAQYSCTNHVLSAPTSQSCNQILCTVATDASGAFSPCTGLCANGSPTYPSCPPPPYPDLTATMSAIPTILVNTPVTLSGTITNGDNGSHTPTSGPFNNFMQMRSYTYDPIYGISFGSTVSIGSVMNTPILAAGASRVISTTHTFTSIRPSPGTGYMIRLCADKSSAGDLGLIDEGSPAAEGNNCSSYQIITIIACTNGATNNPTCNQCPANLAWNAGTSSCVPCSNGGCTGTGGNPTNPIGTLICTNGANNPPQCNQCPANLAWDTGTSSCVPCSNGGCTGTVGGNPTSPIGNLVCNNKSTATPPICAYSQATPNPCYILDGASTCTSVLTFASDPNYVVSPYAMGPTGTIGSGGTAVIDYGTNNFPLGGYTPDYSGSASWGSLNVDGQCLVGSSFDTVTTNTCISSGTPLPDLTAGPTDTTNFAIGQATVVTSQITNIGNDDVTIAFPTFFQIAAGPNGTGAIGGITGTTINSLVSAASKPTQRTFTFISSQSGSMRACANKSNASTFGPVLEADSTNNCSGTWTNFTVTGCPAGTQWDTLNRACVNPQVIAYFITNNYYPPGSLNFSCTGSTDYTILDTTNNTVKVATTTYTTAVSWPVSTEAQYAVKCLSGNVADSKPLYYSVSPPPGSPKINLVITPRTITPNEKVTLTWDTIFPINTCSLTAKVVCANSACSAAQIVEQAKLTAVLVATTTDSNDPHGSSRNLQMAVRTVAPGHTTTDFKALGRKTLTIKYTTDFIYDCGSGRKETKRVQVTKNEER